jgi:membrane protein required for colicin V production
MAFNFILIVLLAGFVLFGLWFGFVHTLGALAGTIVGAYLAGQFYEPVANVLAGLLHLDLNLMRVVAFLVLFVIINRLIGLLFYVIERAFKIVSIIPFLSTIDHLLGAVLGLFEGVIVLGLTLVVAEKFPIGTLPAMIQTSTAAAWLMATASILLPLLPAVVKSNI